MQSVSTLDLSSLPRLPFDQRGHLPAVGAVYVALVNDVDVLYVGQTENLRDRISGHHHKLAFKRGNCRIAWVVESEPGRRASLEQQLIAQFQPSLNTGQPGGSTKRVIQDSQERRIRALLGQPCMTLEVVADRLGVSRQRIHQIAQGLGIDTAERRKVCTLKRHHLASLDLPNTHPKLAERFIVLRDAGNRIEAKHDQWFYRVAKRAVSINGQSCHILINNHETVSMSSRSRVRYYRFGRPRSDADIFILYITVEDAAYVIPRSWLPKTTLCIPRGRIEGYKNQPQRDWEQFREAWHLLADGSPN